MSLGQVIPGRYTANIKDWSLREVEQIPGAIEAQIQFDFKDQAGGLQTVTFKQLTLTKEGKPNKKLIKTLDACGYKHVNIETGEMNLVPFLETDALDMTEPVDITIIDKPSKDGSKVYKEVEWVNRVGGGQVNKPTEEQAKSIADKLVASGVGKPKARPKNFAPGAAGQDDGEELGF